MWVIKSILLLGALGLFLRLLGLIPDSFWRWLKGYREYYYILGGGLQKERRPLRLLPSEVNWKDDAIVVKHVLFFSRPEVYGKARDFWSVEIRKDVRGQLSQAEPYVILKGGVVFWSMQGALEFLGKYPSLQTMLYRNAELEKELVNTNYQLKKSEGQRQLLRADLDVILQVLVEGREKHRSRFSEGLRLFLGSERNYTSDLEAPGEILLDNCRDQLDTCLQRAFARKSVRA